MLDTQTVERPDDGSLEQRPYTLDPVGMDIADDPPFFGVVDCLMPGVGVTDAEVGFEIIGVDGLGLVRDVSLDEFMQGVPLDVGDSLDSDLACLPLNGSGYPGLAFLVSRSYITLLSSDQGFVHFHDAEKSGASEGVIAHRFTDAVAEVPSGSVGGSEGPLHLVSGHSLLGLAHEVNGGKPLTKRQVGILYDRPSHDAELVAATKTIPLDTALDPAHVHIAASSTANSARPAHGL